MVAMQAFENWRNQEFGLDADFKVPFEATGLLSSEAKNVIRLEIERVVLRNTVKAARWCFTAADSGGMTR